MNKPRVEKFQSTIEKNPAANYQRWWMLDDNRHSNMIQLIEAIDNNQKDRKYQNLRHGYLYQNKQDPTAVTTNLPSVYNVTYNVVKSAIDSLTSKLTQDDPRPHILTEKGDYSQQQRGKRLTQYLDGLFQYAQTYPQGSQAFKDGTIFGTGVIKVFPDYASGQVRTERVLITEILVDDLEGSYGNPQNLYQIKLVSKDTLKLAFPGKEAVIDSCASVPSNNSQIVTTEMIKVYEGWHLPDGGGNGGKHCIAILEGELFEENWVHNSFPFAFFRYTTSINSFYGQGVAEELFGTQVEINKILRDIQKAQNLIAVPRVLIEYNAKIVMAHLNNGLGSAVKYQGTKPDFFTPTAMNNEIYSHVKWLIQTAYEKVGVSQLSATGKKPGGVDSKVALRELTDIESDRFSTTKKAYQQFYQDIARLAITFSRELYTATPELSTVTQGKAFIESIKWKDVSLEDDKFITKIYNGSLFPTQPGAKLQKVEEYVRSGWMDRNTAIRLFDFPDIESWETLETANRDYLEKILENILKHGKYTPPEPEMLLEESIEIARQQYLAARHNDADEDKLEMLLRWIEAASSLLPIPQPVMPAAPEPLATPMPLPQTGLLPQS